MALAQAKPLAGKVPLRTSPRLALFKPFIDAMLVEDLSAPRKQQHQGVNSVAAPRPSRSAFLLRARLLTLHFGIALTHHHSPSAPVYTTSMLKIL